MPPTSYEQKKARFDAMLTLFGRKPVLEVLRDESVAVACLHLADSNRDSPELQEMRRLAQGRGAEIRTHSRQALSRISKNGRQDQGVAIDIKPPHYRPVNDLPPGARQLLALDSVTNPQNLGMIIRSVAASPMDGLVIARQGTARIDGLVIKASAGTRFKCPIYHCETLAPALTTLRQTGFRILGLDSHASHSLASIPSDEKIIFVLGNETSGLSSNISGICDECVRIPLAGGVESLNVGVAAALIAFRNVMNQ